MESSFDWADIENASPENRELGAIARQLEELYGGSSPLHRVQSRIWSSEILHRVKRQCAKSLEFEKRLEGEFEYTVGGAEHHLINFGDETRVYKATFDDSFGAYPRFSKCDPDLTGKHFHGSVCENPAYYLRRWMLVNSLGEYQTRFEGFLPPQEGLLIPRICISQPYLNSGNPPIKSIVDGLNALAFDRISDDAFLHRSERILITDAAPRNVRVIDGVMVLFDAIAEIASDEVISWAKSHQ